MKLEVKVENKLNRLVNPMKMNLAEIVKGSIEAAETQRLWGRVSAIEGGVIRIAGLNGAARIGDTVNIEGKVSCSGEIIAIRDDCVLAMPSGPLSGMSPGDRAFLLSHNDARPCEAWIGKVISSNGDYFDDGAAPQGAISMPLNPPPVPVTARRGLGERVNTGLAPFDTFLPLCKGQRIGLFAGAGVGKSTLLGELAKGVQADIIIIALIGERSREVREFIEDVLDDEGRSRTIVFASTSDEAAPLKRRCALLAMATAEYFRDQGLHVLVLFDSITRFADAHREIALTAGEMPSLRAYPPSTFRTIASLAERTGPGSGEAGDITAIFSVLVAGSDMDEPIADMVRSILDGHVVLDREIAERGRFPAIDIRRSVSRSLQKAVSEDEMKLISDGRRMIAAYDDAAPMIQTGLYVKGSDQVIDRAVALWPALDGFISEKSGSCEESFSKLGAVLEG